jgi:hypothetical protein
MRKAGIPRNSQNAEGLTIARCDVRESGIVAQIQSTRETASIFASPLAPPYAEMREARKSISLARKTLAEIDQAGVSFMADASGFCSVG